MSFAENMEAGLNLLLPPVYDQTLDAKRVVNVLVFEEGGEVSPISQEDMVHLVPSLDFEREDVREEGVCHSKAGAANLHIVELTSFAEVEERIFFMGSKRRTGLGLFAE